MTEDVLGVEAGEEWTPPKDPKAAVKGAEKAVDVSKLPEVDPAEVGLILYALSGAAHVALGRRVGADLTMRPDEIEDISGPVARIINRRPALRAMAAQGDLMDAVAIAVGSIKYGVRITGEAFETARKRRDELLEGATTE